MTLLEFQCRHRYPSGFTLDLSLEMREPVTALCGPSGSGKSTTLALVAGLLRPAAGLIRLADRVLLDTAKGTWVRPEQRGIGFIHQDHLLFPHLTVQRNLRYGFSRQTRQTRRKRGSRGAIAMSDVVETLELADLLERYPHTLSGGQRQRVAVARAILRGPDLLLMDEPVSSLDAPLRARVLDYLARAIAEFEIPALVVTHDAAVAERLAGEVVYVEDGKPAGGPAAAAAAMPLRGKP
jgi:molybdate transport system ATP-binding protein